MTTNNEPLVITREFEAPIEKVWQAWSNPEVMMKWWGPKDFTAPVITSDFSVGGICHSCMRSADGTDHWSIGTYKEIIPMKKIVITDSFSNEKGDIVSASEYGMGEDWPDVLMVTIELEHADGKTIMKLTHDGLPNPEMKSMCAEGWNQSFDKLKKVVEAN